MYQSFFVDVVDSFIEYIQLLDADEIEQLDDDLKVNGYGAKCLLEIENACEMLTTFQMFYYFNGRLPLTNGLLIVPDGEATEGTEKIKLNVYLRCLKTNSHGLVSIQFLSGLGIFLGLHLSILKHAITELCKNH